MTVRSFVIGALETIPKGLVKETGRLRNKKTSEDHPLIKIGQNTEKSPGDLKRHDVT